MGIDKHILDAALGTLTDEDSRITRYHCSLGAISQNSFKYIASQEDQPQVCSYCGQHTTQGDEHMWYCENMTIK